MLFRNKRWICGAAFVVAACVIASFYFIYDINKRFPEPDNVHTYTYDNPAVEDGLKITPIECKIYNYNEYQEMYNYSGTLSSFKEGADTDKIRALLFKVQFENTTLSDITYTTDDFVMVARNCGAFNGVMVEDGNNKSVIKPGEKQTFTLSTVLVEDSLVKKKWMNKLDSDTYYFVYWWYPEVKRLEFEVNHG